VGFGSTWFYYRLKVQKFALHITDLAHIKSQQPTDIDHETTDENRLTEIAGLMPPKGDVSLGA
jgi:hypothetical protein